MEASPRARTWSGPVGRTMAILRALMKDSLPAKANRFVWVVGCVYGIFEPAVEPPSADTPLAYARLLGWDQQPTS